MENNRMYHDLGVEWKEMEWILLLLGCVEHSLFDPDYDLTRYTSVWFLIGDFLRLSPQSGDLDQYISVMVFNERFLTCFLTHCESVTSN